MKDVRLTKASGSWRISMTNGLFDWVEDGAQAAQHSTIRLMFFKETRTAPGHYSLNDALPHKSKVGTDWYGKIFHVGLPDIEKEFEIKRRLLATPGIDSIHKFQMTVEDSTLTISGEGKTAWGVVDMTQEFEVL